MGFYRTTIGRIGILAVLASVVIFLAQGSRTGADYAVLVVLLCLSAIPIVIGEVRFRKRGPDPAPSRNHMSSQGKAAPPVPPVPDARSIPQPPVASEGYTAVPSAVETRSASKEPLRQARTTVLSPEEKKALKLAKYTVAHPSLNLLGGEVCYYQGKAKSYHEKNVVVGHRSTGAGVSVRVAKGVRVHTGGGGSESIRSQVGESYDGMFYLTDKRVVLTAMKYGFELPLSKITSINVDPKHGFQFFSGGKSYTVLTRDYHKIKTIMALIEVEQTQTSSGQPSRAAESGASERSYAKELRELKALLDEGILSEEEYSAKKKQILGL